MATHLSHPTEATGSAHASAEGRWLPRAIAVLALAVGACLRIVEYVRNRPLWLDEAMLALNTATRSFASLADPLDYDQTAPLLFLWLSRSAVTVGGVSERTLRVVPFVAGLLLLVALWAVARRLLGETVAAIAVTLAALSHALVSFAVEAKQYGVDPLVTVGIVAAAHAVAQRPKDGRRWAGLALGGAVGLLLSQPAAFAIGGAGFALAATPAIRRDRRALARLTGCVVTWLAVFAGLYAALYSETASSEYMRAFWAGTYLDPGAPDIGARLVWFANALFLHPLLAPSSYAWALPAALAWLMGLGVLARRAPFAAWLVGVPVALLAGAAIAGAYPVMDRLYLFAAPLVLIAYAALLGALIAMTRAPAALSLAAATIGVGLLAAPYHLRHLANPVWYGVSRQVIADVDAMSGSDPVYVAARSLPLWLFYTTDWRAPDMARLAWAASVGGAGEVAHNNAPPRGRIEPGAGASLSREYRGRVEIVGLPTGRQFVTSTRTMDPSVPREAYAMPLEHDSGWAEHEVDRLSAVARPTVWIFGSHMFALDGAESGLVAELQRVGVRLRMERRQGTTVAYHVEFPGRP